MIKFNRYNVTDTKTKVKAKVWYSLDNRADGRFCVTLYATQYGETLRKVFPLEYRNDTDITVDYLEKDRVVLFPGHPYYAAARERGVMNEQLRMMKFSNK